MQPRRTRALARPLTAVTALALLLVMVGGPATALFPASSAYAADPVRRVTLVVTTDDNPDPGEGSPIEEAAAIAIAQARFDEMAAYWADISNGTVLFQLEQPPVWFPGHGTCGSTATDRALTESESRAHVGYSNEPQRYFIANVVNCSTFSGWGGGSSLLSGGSLYMEDPSYRGLWTHEIGHALALQHANMLVCTDGSVDGAIVGEPGATGACRSQVYGDTFDTMASSLQRIQRGFSAPQAIKNGFYAPEEYLNAGGCLAEQTHTIRSRDTEDAPIAVKVTDPTSGTDYYVEYVVNAEYDLNIQGGTSMVDGVPYQRNFGARVLRFAYDGTTLLIPAPADASGVRPTYWTPGSTFTSATGHLAIDFVQQSASDLTVTVTTACPQPQDDAADVAFGVPAQLPILANDSTPALTTLDATSVTFPPTSQPAGAQLSADGRTLTIPGEGTYTADPVYGFVTFAPAAGFAGVATPVFYQVGAASGLTASAALEVTVAAPPPTPSALPTVSAPPEPSPVITAPPPTTAAEAGRADAETQAGKAKPSGAQLPQTGVDVGALGALGLLLLVLGLPVALAARLRVERR